LLQLFVASGLEEQLFGPSHSRGVYVDPCARGPELFLYRRLNRVRADVAVAGRLEQLPSVVERRRGFDGLPKLRVADQPLDEPVRAIGRVRSHGVAPSS